MLKHLYIRHFAIINELELEFDRGLTVLTGETGAGKSILLGALNLVLGDRADSDSIQPQAEFAEIVAEFAIESLPRVSCWLVEQELNAADECILRRRISRDGRSRAYINGTPVNLQVIRELAELLIDIHGQHEHQSIMKADIQRQLVDDYAGHTDLLKVVSTLFIELKLVEEQYQHLQQAGQARNDRLDLLRFQTHELDKLSLQENEYAQLNEQHQRMANAELLLDSVRQAIHSLSEDDSRNMQSELARLLGLLQKSADIDNKLMPVIELLQNAQIQLDECIGELHSYQDTISLDPQQLAETESRLQFILDLSRKHQVQAEQLYLTHKNLLQELDVIDHADERLDELREQCNALETQYLDACHKLTASRQMAARKLNKKITRSMQTLGMSGGQFVIEVTTTNTKHRSAYGLDKIEFTVTTNQGQPCKAISRVASGGELARISLAIQMIMATTSRIPSLIFDEVDSGVGGGIADIVGQHLRALGETSQVICITHLAQVAAQGHQHLRVEKQTRKNTTHSQVVVLNKQQRIEEIARMLSGVEITRQSLAHAEKMLEKSQTRLG